MTMASKHAAARGESETECCRKKSKKSYCHFKSKWRKEIFTVNLGSQKKKQLSGEFLSGEEGGDSATCSICNINFLVKYGGRNDVLKHFASNSHQKALTAKSTSFNLAKYGLGHSETAKRAREKQDELQQQVQKAEAVFIQFVAEHNLTFRTGDHFTKLVKSMFPDSEIAKRFQCSRTKTSVLTRFGNGKFCQDQLVNTLISTDMPVFFSLLIDESNDRGVEAKDLAILVRFFDPVIMKAVTRFLDLPTANNGTAAAIFEKVHDCLESKGISYDRMICFNSDTCNTMKGQRNGVVRHLRDQQPALIDLGCICHLENLALKAAMKTLPVSIDSLLVDINTHFYLSVKRKEELKGFCEFVNITYKKILSHVETRWLSLLKVISRILELWPAIVSYFHSHPEREKRGRVSTIAKLLSEETKLYLLFLNSILPTINSFNVAFQATNYSTIYLLHPEMKKLTKRLLRCFVKLDVIQTNDITQTEYQDQENQLESHDLEIGNDARILALNLEENGFTNEVKRFHDHVRLFFSKLVQTIFLKFPFNSTFLSDLRILNPAERQSYNDFPGAVVRLANELPQLELSEKLDQLKTEAIDYQMADSKDLPAATDTDLFWAEMHNVKGLSSVSPIYDNLLLLVRALLSIPASNADSERCFSMIRKIDSEERSQLCRQTIASLLALKLNIDEECYNYDPQQELLTLNKSRVRKYNNDHGSYTSME